MRWSFSNFGGWVACDLYFFLESLLWDYGNVLRMVGIVLWEGVMLVKWLFWGDL